MGIPPVKGHVAREAGKSAEKAGDTGVLVRCAAQELSKRGIEAKCYLASAK